MSPGAEFVEMLARDVREAWMQWANTQPEPKPSWLVPYDGLGEPDKEADRQIGIHMFLKSLIIAFPNRVNLARLASRGELSPHQMVEHEITKKLFFDALAKLYPGPPIDLETLNAIEDRLKHADSNGNV